MFGIEPDVKRSCANVAPLRKNFLCTTPSYIVAVDIGTITQKGFCTSPSNGTVRGLTVSGVKVMSNSESMR